MSQSVSPHPTLHSILPDKERGWFRPTLHSWKVSLRSGETFLAHYNSREVRKGRLPLRLHHHGEHGQTIPLRVRYSHDKIKWKKGLMKDISFWVAVLFWWGSAVWVANGFTVWLPVVRPETESEAMAKTASALAFLGGTLFEVGAYLGLLEAGNRGKHSDFGSSLDRVLFGLEYAHSRRAPSLEGSPSSSEKGGDMEKLSSFDPDPDWEWMPKMRLHELGYMAALVQMFAATIFWVSTLTGVPGVIPGFSDGEGSITIVDVFFWLPQVIGGIGFVISSLLLMIEVQPKWWKIKPLALGWQIGVWNLVGAFGFLLCGALGFSSSSKAIWQSDLSTFWGGWAFLIGSTFQMYEATSAVSVT